MSSLFKCPAGLHQATIDVGSPSSLLGSRTKCIECHVVKRLDDWTETIGDLCRPLLSTHVDPFQSMTGS